MCLHTITPLVMMHCTKHIDTYESRIKNPLRAPHCLAHPAVQNLISPALALYTPPHCRPHRTSKWGAGEMAVQECESVEDDRFGISRSTPGRASETHQIAVSLILAREAGDSPCCSRLSSPAASFNKRASQQRTMCRATCCMFGHAR